MMAGIILSQWMRHFMHNLMYYFWPRLSRRKPLILAVIIISTLFIIAYNYNVQSSILKENNISPYERSQRQSIQDPNNFDLRNKPESLAQENHEPSSLNQETHQSKNIDLGVGANPVLPDQLKSQNEKNLVHQQDNIFQQSSSSKSNYIPSLRFIHLDLKGAPPKISYFKQLFPLLKQAGANGILLEYEDMFPFHGYLKPGAAGNAYSQEDILELNNLARINNFEVIPLVQTFGHLEMFLKLPEFRHLRELDEYPQAICPSNNNSFTLVTQIIDQVMSLNPQAKWLHVGCDEVFHIGYCDKCRMKDRDTLFLDHVARVSKYVRDKHNVIPIIWDDMMRQISSDRIKQVKMESIGVEIMIWTYIKDIYRFIPYSQWMSFAEVFPNVWTASAFKGAFGETLTVPNTKMHLENNDAWIEVMAEQNKNFKSIRGIVITGWQRYDHFGALCELLPAGIPSLLLNLLTVSEGGFEKNKKSIFSKFDKIMGCSSSYNANNFYNSYAQDNDIENDPYLFSRASNCVFPGSSIFRMVQQNSDAIKRVNDYLYDVTIHKAWLTDYNIRHNMTSPYRVDEGLQEYPTVYYNLQAIMKTAKDALREVYDEYTVSEWIEQNIYPYVLKMEKLMQNSINLKKARVWPKRPLPQLEDLRKRISDVNVGNNNNNEINENNNQVHPH